MSRSGDAASFALQTGRVMDPTLCSSATLSRVVTQAYQHPLCCGKTPWSGSREAVLSSQVTNEWVVPWFPCWVQWEQKLQGC